MIRSVLHRTSLAGLATLLACIALNQACAQSYSLWPSATPANANDPDASSVELGVKFTSSVNGTVSAIRFYKSLQNTGTHTVALWTSGGAKLASATAANETASGWQTVTLSAPINIAAGTTYVASYHAPYGHYADDQNYFAYSNGVLAAPRYAGVYTYSTGSSFPTSSWNDSNYWVDIVFNQASLTPVNGACGSSNGADLTSAPTTNLCSAGAAIDRHRQRPVVMELRRQQRRDHGDLLSARSCAAGERRMRLREWCRRQHRADQRTLHERRSLHCQRQRAVELELRRIERRLHRNLLGASLVRLRRRLRRRRRRCAGSWAKRGALCEQSLLYLRQQQIRLDVRQQRQHRQLDRVALGFGDCASLCRSCRPASILRPGFIPSPASIRCKSHTGGQARPRTNTSSGAAA